MTSRFLIFSSSLLLFVTGLSACKSQRTINVQPIPSRNSLQSSQTSQSYTQASSPVRFLVIGSAEGAGMESDVMKELVHQVDQQPPLFMLGLGNQVGGFGRTQFLNIIRYRSWWENYFFPALGPGENVVYGESESDYGAGVQFLHRNRLLSEALTQKKSIGHAQHGVHYHIEMASTHDTAQQKPANYLMRVTVGDFRIWVWHLYSYKSASGISRPPHAQAVRWLASSMNQVSLRGQKRSSRDLLVVMSHGHEEFWLKDLLSTPEGQQISKLADVLLSGQGSVARRISWSGLQLPSNQQPLFLSLGHLNDKSPLVLDAEFLPNPDRLRLAFRRLDDATTVHLPAFIKYLRPGGGIREIKNEKQWKNEHQSGTIMSSHGSGTSSQEIKYIKGPAIQR